MPCADLIYRDSVTSTPEQTSYTLRSLGQELKNGFSKLQETHISL